MAAIIGLVYILNLGSPWLALKMFWNSATLNMVAKVGLVYFQKLGIYKHGGHDWFG